MNVQVSPSGFPALVLNADFRPLSYYPLSLWSWQDAIKAVFLDRVNIVANYDRAVHSPSLEMKLPSVVSLKTFVKPSTHPAFTRFNVFLRDRFSCQYCGTRDDLTFDHLIPRSRRTRAVLIGDEIFTKVGGYVLGNVITSFIAGAGTFLWMLAWGIPYPALLGLLIFLLDLIPVIGSTIGGAIVTLVALTVSIPVAIATLVFYVTYRLAEDYLLVPRIIGHTVKVPAPAMNEVITLPRT